MQARNHFLDQGRYLEIDSVNSEKINEFIRKGRQTFEEKKISIIFTPHISATKTYKIEKKKGKSSIRKKMSAWDATGRRQDKEQKSYLPPADG